MVALSSAPTVRRRLGPHHHQPPRRVCSSCAAFSWRPRRVWLYVPARFCIIPLIVVGMPDRFAVLAFSVFSACLVCRFASTRASALVRAL